MNCIEHSIKCRMEVYRNLKKYGLNDSHKPMLVEGINKFRKMRDKK